MGLCFYKEDQYEDSQTVGQKYKKKDSQMVYRAVFIKKINTKTPKWSVKNTKKKKKKDSQTVYRAVFLRLNCIRVSF